MRAIPTEVFVSSPIDEWPRILSEMMDQKPEPEKLLRAAVVCRGVKKSKVFLSGEDKSTAESTILALEKHAKKGVEERRKRREQLIPYQSRERFRVA